MEHLVLSTPPAWAEAFYAVCFGVRIALLLLILGTLVGALVFVVRGYRQDAILKMGLLAFGCMFCFYWLHSIETTRWYFWEAVTGNWFDPGLNISHFAGWALLMSLFGSALYVLFAKHSSSNRFDRRSIASLLLCCLGLFFLIRHWASHASYRPVASGLSKWRDHTFVDFDTTFPFLHFYPHANGQGFIEALGGKEFLGGELCLALSAILAAYTLRARSKHGSRNAGGLLAACIIAIALGRGSIVSIWHSPWAPSPYAVDVPAQFSAPIGTSGRVRDLNRLGPLFVIESTGELDDTAGFPERLFEPANDRWYGPSQFNTPRFLIDERTNGKTVELILQRCLSLGVWKIAITTQCEHCDIVRDSMTYLIEREHVKHLLAWERGAWTLNGQSFRNYEDISWPPRISGFIPGVSYFAIDVGSAPAWQHVVDLVDWMAEEEEYFDRGINLMVPAEKL